MDKRNKIGAANSIVVFGGVNQKWLPSMEAAGWSCHRCYDLRAAESLLLEMGPCVGVVDLSNDDFSLHSLAALVNRNKQVRWIAIVRDEQLNNEAISQFIVNFCLDYFSTPVPCERLKQTIGHQSGMLALERQVWPQLGQFGQQGLQGNTPVMKKLRDQVKRVALSDVPVLINGEIGTGKLVVAEALHQASVRAKKPLVRVNCENLQAGWINEVGQNSYLDYANNGVLVLNEFTLLADERKKEVLKILSDGVYYHPDGSILTLDIRFIATSSHNFEDLSELDTLTRDLYFRLNVVSLTVPALRERGGDIVLLAEFLLLKYARQYNSVAKTFSEQAKAMLLQYQWPGNVRELISQIKRSVLLVETKCIEAEHLDIPRVTEDKQSLKKIREESERTALLTVLENNKGQISAAARELGVSRATMYRLLNKHDLIPPPRCFRQG
ncbi:sigma-54-dependent transcriptional regulator [Photobacterium angustum]|uniref:Putative sigma-54 dependent transcriptional regulator n=1 Tax=Photobacterium angustum (strain S14 / CCUG 15956) TaxID=314292 RepID=Q1ZML8_PHOAS|nr:VpsR-related response regulator [Photobacterium angustum]EAS63421.1 putative sigma-54 dependent transcriptional regulator [Photobacterium angustum S14]KJG17255.1 Fis family transcriptional regulator [Photobacterium angustum]KJG23640.1 Fis family transcriptional regulator [Photobacterium angustum]KJG30760.1 Fis family transcriptional regulator [Photobacterium angustum]PSW94128.1 sigma-54-dependent Fis family transcriptional regulator [Photobacterium angustum]